ncbi:tetratricopeptide repeat protein [filamentous cyanobacterium LEGE 11480]|uniref:Tetratricopeptide repeat protein n=1 Tax=Romeriopsis navalis LEGE 11480 TaxID=2777977 RepID=A0A928Z4L1_9CYAN|nr:tetratricopeptide repeat protein [Romeriopsis navalis LEGE 11480]
MQQVGSQFGAACLFLLSAGTPLIATAFAQPAQAQSANSNVRRGYTQLSQGLVDQAIATFKSVLNQSPNSLEAKLGLAIGYARAGRDEDAWNAYQRVLEQDSRNRLALQAVGKLGGFRPEWQPQGIAALTTLLDITPDDLEARAQRALLYSYQSRFTESLSDYQIVLQSPNPTADVLLGAAQAYTYSGNPTQGLTLFERYQAESRDPIGKNAAIAYARALRETGNPSKSIGVLEAVLPSQLDDFALQVRGELAQSYLANNQSALALGVLDPLRDRADARLPLARALNEIGKQTSQTALRGEAAQLYLAELQATGTTDTTLVREVADVLGGIPGQQQVALNLYRQLVQQNPNDRILAIRRLALESRLGSLPQAQVIQQVQALLQPFPADPAQQQAVAQALIPLEPNVALLPVYQALLQAGVNEPFLHFRMAQLLIEQGNLAAAQAAIATYKASPQGTKDLAPDILLADIDRRQGNYEASAQRYLRLLAVPNLDPDVAYSALRGLAGIRVVQNRAVEALALYDQLLQRNPGDWQLRLGRTAIAYQAKLISAAAADAVLVQFLQFNPGETPQEFYTLATLLPPSPQREPLYRALLQADPSNLDVQVRLIQVLSQRNPLEAQAMANRLLVQAQRMVTANPNSTLQTLFLRGRLAAALGNLKQAGDAYQAILSWQANNLEAVSALGGIRFQQRDFAAASQLYSYVLAFQPDNTTAQRSLAELAAAQGNAIEALDRFNFIQSQQGGGPENQQRIRQLQESFLQRRGFNPSWERF